MCEVQDIKCLFDQHDWVWSLTEIKPQVFVISGKCVHCSIVYPTAFTEYSLQEALIMYQNFVTGKINERTK